MYANLSLTYMYVCFVISWMIPIVNHYCGLWQIELPVYEKHSDVNPISVNYFLHKLLPIISLAMSVTFHKFCF